MPSIKNIETVELVAENYCSNGHNKTKAMVDAKYSPKYADTGQGQEFVFGNIRVKAAIARIVAETKAENIANREQRQQFWTRIMSGKASIPCNMGDMLRASELLGKSEADFTDKYQDTGLQERKRQLTEAEQAEAKRIAQIRLRQG
jgi:hypothetical protein